METLHQSSEKGPAKKGSITISLSFKGVFIAGLLTGAAVFGGVNYLWGTRNVAGNNQAPIQVAAAQPNQPQPSANAGAVAAGAVPPVTAQDHIRGDKNAPLTLIEYSDYECPFCKRFHPTMLQMMNDYAGKIKWVYRDFPLSFHQNAQKESEAAECANELGGNDAFWKYTDGIFERTTSNGTGFALSALAPLAKEIGLDQNKFQKCLDSGKYAQHVQQEEAGGSSAGVTGTPGSILIGKDGKSQLIEGAVPYAQIKSVIDSMLN